MTTTMTITKNNKNNKIEKETLQNNKTILNFRILQNYAYLVNSECKLITGPLSRVAGLRMERGEAAGGERGVPFF